MTIIGNATFVRHARHVFSGSLWLGLALPACSNDTVYLGGDTLQQPVLSARCGESRRIEQSVRVTQQAELDALAGCEVIEGDLVVEAFADADLRPLAALRAVGGSLQLGDVAPQQLRDGTPPRLLDGARWLASLAGLEGLERVGNLMLEHTGVPDLLPLSNLQNLSSHYDGTAAGLLIVVDNPRLTSLAGLEQAGGVRELSVLDNAALESLGGLRVGTQLDGVFLEFSPLLRELPELRPLTRVEGPVLLMGLGITSADDLANLRVATTLSLVEDAELAQVDALGGLEAAAALELADLPRLERLPAFPSMVSLQAMTLARNPSLGRADLSLPALRDDAGFDGLPVFGGSQVLVVDNDALTELSFGDGLTRIEQVELTDNAALSSVNLGSIQRIGTLSVQRNPSLSQVELGALAQVDTLSISDNPPLDAASFDPLAAP